MGLIKAGVGAVNGVLADQWKEFFYCEALDKDILVTKGQKRVGKRSSNTCLLYTSNETAHTCVHTHMQHY